MAAITGVTPLVTANFERYLMREAPRMPFGATLLVLTAVNSMELAETLVQLKRHGRKITLISFAKEPPAPIPRVRTIHLPFEAEG